MFGYNTIKADVSVINLDNGYMLVTLYKGAIITYLNGEICIPNVEQTDFPNFTTDDIYWVTQETLLSYSKYMETKGSFMYDFEFFYTLSGEVKNGLSNFKYCYSGEKDVDISLGKYGVFLQNRKNKEDANKAKKLSNLFVSSSDDMEFEDDEFEDDNDEFEDDDEFDF